MKMVENQRIVIDQDPPIFFRQSVAGQVPRRQIRAFMLQNTHTGETLRPIVEILLIGVTVRLQAIETPIDALSPPGCEALPRDRVVAETQPADVESAVFLEMTKRGRKPMFDDENRIAA